MGDYTITMRRSPHISDEERRRRLYAAYSLLLSLSDDKQTADRCELADPDRSAADAPAPQQGREPDRECTS